MIKLSTKNLRWLLIGALAGGFMLFFAVLFLGMSVLSSASSHMVDLNVQSQTADAQLANLEKAKQAVKQYSYFKDVAKTVIPNDKDQAQSVLEINQMADAAGIQLQSITFPASNLGGLSGTASAATATASTAISQAKPVSGIPGLYSLELTVTPDSKITLPADKQVTYAKMLDFLQRIENNRHTAQITDVKIQPPTASQTLSFTLTLNIFIKP